MNSWKQRKLKELCEIKGGKRLPIGENFSSHGYPYIRARDIKNGKVKIEAPVFVSEAVREKIKRYTTNKNDILITIVGANIGDVGIVPEELDNASLSENAVRLTNYKGIFHRYLINVLLSPYSKQIMQQASAGAAQGKLGIYKINEIPVSVPPLPIQRKIASVLTAYDDLIENNNRRIAILEKMAEEIYREWFVRLRFPEHEKTKIVKGVPDGWEVKRIGDVANATMGQSPPSEFYNQNGDGLPFNQGVGTYGKRYPRKDVYCNTKGRIANKGDILISVRAPVGRLNIADCKMIIGRGLSALNHKEGKNSYLYYLLKNTFSSEDVIGNGT
ncbi:MAG: restriction endonuclease subunit S, partial [Desulfamplus sp.]|nr:restriction endonuclease subunit S [Desulfamplus sp.]